MIKPVRIPNFYGGLNKAEKSIIPDNALSEATDVFFNKDKILQSRGGVANFGAPIPDAVKLLHDCDTVAGNGTWAGTDDAAGVAINTASQKRGVAAIEFDVDVSASVNHYATLTNSSFTAVDVSTVKGSVRFWVFVPTGGTTDLTNIELRVGSDSTNYYSWTHTTFTANSWNLIQFDYADATTTGTPNDAAIDYLLFRVNYAAGYLDSNNWMIDSIMSYSNTSTKPMMGLHYFRSSESADGFPRSLTTNCGTALYEYSETYDAWDAIKTGLTEGARFSMTAYKNIMNFTNGVDNFFAYDFKNCVDKTGANTYKGKYVIMANDIGYITGDPAAPTTVGYTGGAPANLDTFPNAIAIDEDGSDGIATGLINLGPIVFVMKERKIYQLNVATPSREAIDYSSGFLAHRALINVENEILGMNSEGIYSLAQRQATVGSIRAESRSDQIKQIIDQIADKKIISAIYVGALNNAYFFVDTNGDSVPDTALVYSVLTKAWTRYTNMAINQAVLYEDAAGVFRFLGASAISGQCKELEVGTNDSGATINFVVNTKDFDFGQPESFKTFEMFEVFGYINENGSFKVRAFVDDEDATGEITIDSGFADISESASYTLGTSPLAELPLGGETLSTSATTVYPFKARIPMYSTGSRIRLELMAGNSDTVFLFTKASIYPYGQPIDIYPNSNIA